MQRYNIKVYGQVQGVGFRAYTKEEANKFDIKGWVKNKNDGTVEIDAEGTSNNMEDFLSSIEKGYSDAKIENIETDEMYELKVYSSFKIKH